MERSSKAVWQGSGKEGKGFLTTESLVLNKTEYSFSTRFADGTGTNPEELIAAAHAGCFNMKLSFVLGEQGYVPDKLETTCQVTIEDGVIISSNLDLLATINGIDEATFLTSIKDALDNCPISMLLDTDVAIEAALENGA